MHMPRWCQSAKFRRSRAWEIVYAHREKFDGTGYPRGLKGAAILLGARIAAVAD
jgi:response regulator RpfG family c-di-GMP phosphodiesterase